MEIRIATSNDLNIFLPAKEEFFRDYNIPKKSKKFYKEEFKGFIKGILILTIDEDKVIGYLSGKVETNLYEKYGYISEIFVRKELRGRGISTKLKDKFLEILKENQISLCRVEVPYSSCNKIN